MSHSIDKLINNFFYKLANNKDNSFASDFVSDYSKSREIGERNISEFFSKHEKNDIEFAAMLLKLDISEGVQNLSRAEQYMLKHKVLELELEYKKNYEKLKQRTGKEILESLQENRLAVENAIARARGHKNTNLEAYPTSGQLEYKVTSEGDLGVGTNKSTQPSNYPSQPSNYPSQPSNYPSLNEKEEQERKIEEIKKAIGERTLAELIEKHRKEYEEMMAEKRKNRPSLRR